MGGLRAKLALISRKGKHGEMIGFALSRQDGSRIEIGSNTIRHPVFGQTHRWRARRRSSPSI